MKSIDRADADVRLLMTNAIAKSGKSRVEIAAEMSESTGAEITKAMLDAWTAGSKARWRFPFIFATAFELATGARALTNRLSEQHGLRLIDSREELFLRLGHAAYESAEAGSKMSLLRGQIRE